MEKTPDMPLWVYLVVASVETKKGALLLVYSMVLFTLYCLPWSTFFAGSETVAQVFRIDDWSWFAMMVPMTLWYWLAVKWVDNRRMWKSSNA